jgi:hypothetical protein
MALAESIFAALSADAAVTAHIGTGSTARLFPLIAPPGTAAPYVVFQLISLVPDLTLGEASASGRHLVQLSIVAPTYAAALALAIALTAALDSVTLAAGELCLSCTRHEAHVETTDEYLSIVEAEFFVPAAA